MALRVFMFPYRDQFSVPYVRSDFIGLRAVYHDQLPLSFIRSEAVGLRAKIKPFKSETEAGKTRDLVMRLVHDKLVFGVDPFLLGQLDSLKFDTIDNFPLNVQ